MTHEAATPLEGEAGASARRVAMLVWNPCVTDSRVIKEATSLSSAGYEVTVVCLKARGVPRLESRDGVTYRRVDPAAPGAILASYVRLLGRRASRPRDPRAGSWRDALLAGAPLGLVAGGNTAALSLSRYAAYIEAALMAATTLLIIGLLLYLQAGALAAAVAVAAPMTMLSVVAVRRVRCSMGRFLRFRQVLLSVQDAVVGLKPAVVHAHDLTTLPAAAVLAKSLGAALVYDTHELALELSNPPKGLARWLHASRERRCIRQASRVVTVSDSIAEHLVRAYAIDRPLVVYNSPPISAFRTTGRDVRGDLELPSDQRLAIFVGGLSFHRGLDVLVDALALSPSFHLATVGPRNAAWEARLHARAQDAGADARLHFLDPVPVEELTVYLATADVAVIPYQNVCLNHEYCMPNKLFECVLAGLPVVVANLTDLRRFVERHRVGRAADETDPSALARAMEEVAATTDLRATGDRLISLQREYGWDAQGDKLVALYGELTDRARR